MLFANFLFSFEFPVDFKLNGKNWAEKCHHKNLICRGSFQILITQYIFQRAALEFAPLLDTGRFDHSVIPTLRVCQSLQQGMR